MADHAWAYSIVDSSRVSTFFISILLIVYGSFRSLALEEDKDGKEEQGMAMAGHFSAFSATSSTQELHSVI